MFGYDFFLGLQASQLCAQQPLQGELAQRCQQLQCRLSTLHIENEEVSGHLYLFVFILLKENPEIL